MDIDKAVSNYLINMKHQRDMLKARQTKASLISLRKQWLDQQKKEIINQNMTESEGYWKAVF